MIVDYVPIAPCVSVREGKKEREERMDEERD